MRYVPLISLLALIPNVADATPAPTTIVCFAELETTFSRFPEQIGQRNSTDARIYKLDDAARRITGFKEDGSPIYLCGNNCEMRYGPYTIEWTDTIIGPELKVTMFKRIDRISGNYYESHDTYFDGGRLLAMEGGGFCESFPPIKRKF